MEQFTKLINGTEFGFHGFLEGEDEVCRVSAAGQNFKMTVAQDGDWQIRQQVPAWIKSMEKELGAAIEQAYC